MLRVILSTRPELRMRAEHHGSPTERNGNQMQTIIASLLSACAGALLAIGLSNMPSHAFDGLIANVAAQRPVACAQTEDSILTTCGTHPHRLDYRRGGWYAPRNGS